MLVGPHDHSLPTRAGRVIDYMWWNPFGILF